MGGCISNCRVNGSLVAVGYKIARCAWPFCSVGPTSNVAWNPQSNCYPRVALQVVSLSSYLPRGNLVMVWSLPWHMSMCCFHRCHKSFSLGQNNFECTFL
jgi:hypothetical protein